MPGLPAPDGAKVAGEEAVGIRSLYPLYSALLSKVAPDPQQGPLEGPRMRFPGPIACSCFYPTSPAREQHAGSCPVLPGVPPGLHPGCAHPFPLAWSPHSPCARWGHPGAWASLACRRYSRVPAVRRAHHGDCGQPRPELARWQAGNRESPAPLLRALTS